MFVEINFKSPSVEVKDQLKYDIFQEKVGIAFFDLRGLPVVVDVQEVLNCYTQQGVRALSNLCLGYACIICDGHHQRVIFASDNTGHTTFFYQVIGNRIQISDSLSPLNLSCDAMIDRQSFQMYLECGFVPGERTIYKNIFKLPPGGYLTIEKGRIHRGNYSEIPRVIRRRVASLKEELKESLVTSVARTLLKPTGVMLSGGFDSSFLCQIAQAYDKQVRTFTIGSWDYNPQTLDQGIRMAKILGTQHEVIEISIEEYLSSLPLTALAMDEPVLDLDTAFIYPALRRMPAKIEYLLHGVGSDQLIGNLFGQMRKLVTSKALTSSSVFGRYKAIANLDRRAGLFFIREKIPQEVRLHYRLSSRKGARLIFPFLEPSMVRLALQMPNILRKDKQLLRSLAPTLNKIFAVQMKSKVTGQIPGQLKDLTLKVYGNGIMQSRLLCDLVGKSRLSVIFSSRKKDEALRLVVFSLWVKKNLRHQDHLSAA